MKSELVKSWDKIAKELSQIPLVDEQVRYVMAIKPLISLPKSSLILEAGCGSGRLLRVLAALGYSHLIGIEISFARLDEVRQLGPTCVKNICSDAIPFASLSFDAVVSAAVIEHVLHPDEWLAELARVTKPEGLVSIVTDTYMWKWLKWAGLYRSIQPFDEALWPFTLIRWAKHAGLELIGCGGFTNTPLQEYYFGKQILKLIPGAKWLRRRLKRKILPSILSDESLNDLKAVNYLHEKVKMNHWACIGSYECYYWFRKR